MPDDQTWPWVFAILVFAGLPGAALLWMAEATGIVDLLGRTRGRHRPPPTGPGDW